MIITISRGSFSGGTVVAECVAEQLGYRLVSREILAAAAEQYGVAEQRLAEALERAPGLWERLGHERRLYLVYIQGALLDAAEQDDVVYHGHAGHLLLRDISHVLRVRLIAPTPFRVSAAMRRLRCSRESAEAHVRRVDEERARWTRFLYGIDWNSPLLYDLVVNLDAMGVRGACAAIRATAALPEFQPTAVSRKALRDLALACRVRGALARHATTAHAELEVVADDGRLSIHGNLRDDELMRTALDIARTVPQVVEVHWEGQAG
ncbi:MAG: cytidylate kinase family protein [Polyangiaceae bacterium]|nr:cytidylate kinase family protein [Polyangiaceae bacterium]